MEITYLFLSDPIYFEVRDTNLYHHLTNPFTGETTMYDQSYNWWHFQALVF